MPKNGSKKALAAAKAQALSDYTSSPTFGVPQEEPADRSVQFSPEQEAKIIQEVKDEKAYGDNTGEAFAEGALRGLVPFSDYVLRAAGVSQERLKQVKERQELAAGVGEATGLVGGALLSGGANVEAKAAIEGAEIAAPTLLNKAAQYTIGGAASKLETAGAKKIAESMFADSAGKTLTRNLIDKSLQKGLAAGIVGAGFGINNLVNESALGEADLTGENLIAYAGTGAVLNGLVGGAFGAAEAAAPRAAEAFEDLSGKIKKATGQTFDYTKNMAELSAGAKTSESRSIQAALKERNIGEDKLKQLVDERYKWNLNDDAAVRYEKAVAAGDQIGKDIEGVYRQVDVANPHGVIDKVGSNVELHKALTDFEQMKPELFDNAANRNTLEKVQEEIMTRARRTLGKPLTKEGEFAANGESVTEFWKAVQNWGKQGYDSSKSKTEKALYEQLNQKGREILQRSIDTATEGTNSSAILDQLKKYNEDYSIHAILRKGLKKNAVGGRPDLMGLKDYGVVGVGLIKGGPLGAAAAYAGKKFLESDLKRKLVVLNTAQRANNQAMKLIGNGIKGFFEGGKQVVKTLPKASFIESGFTVGKKRKKPANEKEAFNNMTKNIAELQADPNKLAMAVAGATMKAGYAAPNATKFAQMSLARSVQFLASKMPKDMKAGMSILGDREFKPSSIELSKFKRYVQAVEQPYSIMDELQDGTLTREHVEAVQAVYPAIYRDIQQQVLKYVANEPKISYNKKIQLGTLLKIPIDPSLTPMTVLSLQSNFPQDQQAGQTPDQNSVVKPTAGGLKELNVAGRAKSGVEENLTAES